MVSSSSLPVCACLCVCVCVCVCVYYACIHTYVCIVHTCIHTSPHTHIHIRTHIHMHTTIYANTHAHTYITRTLRTYARLKDRTTTIGQACIPQQRYGSLGPTTHAIQLASHITRQANTRVCRQHNNHQLEAALARQDGQTQDSSQGARGARKLPADARHTLAGLLALFHAHALDKQDVRGPGPCAPPGDCLFFALCCMASSLPCCALPLLCPVVHCNPCIACITCIISKPHLQPLQPLHH